MCPTRPLPCRRPAPAWRTGWAHWPPTGLGPACPQLTSVLPLWTDSWPRSGSPLLGAERPQGQDSLLEPQGSHGPGPDWIPRQIQNPRGSRAQSPQPRGEASSESNSQHPRATPTHYPTAEQSCAAHNPRLRPQLAPLRREGSFSGTQLTGQDALSWVGQRSPKACPPGASGCDPGNRVSADVITAHRVASDHTRLGWALHLRTRSL